MWEKQHCVLLFGLHNAIAHNSLFDVAFSFIAQLFSIALDFMMRWTLFKLKSTNITFWKQINSRRKRNINQKMLWQLINAKNIAALIKSTDSHYGDRLERFWNPSWHKVRSSIKFNAHSQWNECKNKNLSAFDNFMRFHPNANGLCSKQYTWKWPLPMRPNIQSLLDRF